MKILAALSLVFLAACASSGGFVDDRNAECGGESLIDVRVGLNAPAMQMEQQGDRLTLLVEVSNNSSADIVVKTIRIEQLHAETAGYALEDGWASFDETIAEADDHTFEVPMNGRGLRSVNDRRRIGSGLAVAAAVSLEDGRTLRCRFEIQGPQ